MEILGEARTFARQAEPESIKILPRGDALEVLQSRIIVTLTYLAFLVYDEHSLPIWACSDS
jgi:hypothetical protein